MGFGRGAANSTVVGRSLAAGTVPAPARVCATSGVPAIAAVQPEMWICMLPSVMISGSTVAGCASMSTSMMLLPMRSVASV